MQGAMCGGHRRRHARLPSVTRRSARIENVSRNWSRGGGETPDRSGTVDCPPAHKEGLMAIAVDKFPRKAVTEYAKARKELQNGDVLICSGSGVFSSMIQQATDSVWSHVAFILRLDEIDRIMLLESVESVGVRTIR